jgi:hypothetical protein
VDLTAALAKFDATMQGHVLVRFIVSEDLQDHLDHRMPNELRLMVAFNM